MPRKPPADSEVVDGIVICATCKKPLERIEWSSSRGGPSQIQGKHVTATAAEACRLLRSITRGARV